MAVENIEEFSDCDHFRLVVPVAIVVVVFIVVAVDVIFVIGNVAVQSELLHGKREH